MASIFISKIPNLSTRFSAMKKNILIKDKQFIKFSNMTFSQILLSLNNFGFSNIINNNYLKEEGFYLIEKIINDKLSSIYTMSSKYLFKKNKKLYSQIYLKYQIHNFLTYVRIKKSKGGKISTFLIGDKKNKELFLSNFSYPLEEGIKNICKKLNLNSENCIKMLDVSIFDFENYLYKTYYEKLGKTNFYYKKVEDVIFKKIIKNQIDIENLKSYSILKEEKKSNLFDDLYISNGNFQKKDFQKKDFLESFLKKYDIKKDFSKINKYYIYDEIYLQNKILTEKLFKKISSTSPYSLFKNLFKIENNYSKLRTFLKMKYGNIDKKNNNW